MDGTVLLVTSNGMGEGPVDLQQKLIGTYMRLLLEQGNLPNSICFYTDGVNLVVEGSPIISQLKELETKGVRLIICSTCLNYFGITEKVQVGIVGGMGDILEAQWKADKVITL